MWKGDPQLPPLQQRLKVLGVPIGQPEFIREFLQRKSGEQATIFERIPWVNDPQAAYLLLLLLLLLMCGSTRANFLLSAISPDLTEEFATRHDSAVWRCLCTILGTPSAPEACCIVIFQWRFGVSECLRVRRAAHSFRQLGRQSPDGEETPPSHRSDYDQKTRGGYHSNFRSRARMQRFSGGGWSSGAFLV